MSVLIKNVRTRLTLWYVLVFAFILLIYAGFAVSLIYLNLRGNLDQELQEEYEILETIIRINPNGIPFIDEDDASYLRENWFEIWSNDGKKLIESRPFSSKNLPPIPKEVVSAGNFRFRSIEIKNNIHLRVMYGRVNIEGKWLQVRLIKNEEPLWKELYIFAFIMLIALPFSIFIAAGGGYFLSKKLLAPVEQMAESARKISETNLQKRLPVINQNDELGNLAVTFNALLDRLEKSFIRLKQFTSDAAHELRTPLTAIRSTGEVSLQQNRNSAYYRNVIGSILEENVRLTRLIDSLLFLSQADFDRIKLHKTVFGLFEFLGQAIELIQPLAEEKNQTIDLKGDQSIRLKADRDLLREAVLNILDNAIKYAPSDTKITVKIVRNSQNTAISVEDEGRGIPEQEKEKIFQRFYRVDKARSRALGGSGLGLAISLWAVQIQGGTINAHSRGKMGSTFTIVLPWYKNDEQG